MDEYQPIVLTDEDRIIIAEAAKEIDLRVAEINRRLTTEQRSAKVFSLCNMIVENGIQRLREQFPDLSVGEAQRMFLKRYYELESRHYGDKIFDV